MYEKHRKTILDNYTILPLEAANLMQVTTIEETVNDMINTAGSQLKAIQEFLFTLTADVRMPLVEGIKLTRRQKKSFKKSLKPGDIILTFSSGYHYVIGFVTKMAFMFDNPGMSTWLPFWLGVTAILLSIIINAHDFGRFCI